MLQANMKGQRGPHLKDGTSFSLSYGADLQCFVAIAVVVSFSFQASRRDLATLLNEHVL